MDLATTMFPLKAGTPAKGQTLPHHLWPKSVLHDVYAIRTRAKALRRMAALVATTPNLTMDSLSDTESPHHSLWLRVTNPLILRTAASPPIRNLEALSLADSPDAEDDEDTDTPSHDITNRLTACFKAQRRTTRLLLKHARNQRRLKYGQSLLRMFFKKPRVALQSILRTTAAVKAQDSQPLPTNLSIIGTRPRADFWWNRRRSSTK
jgi:hypothetical protein